MSIKEASASGQTPGAIPFAPLQMFRAGGRARRAVLLWLALCTVTIPSGMLTRVFEWTGLAIELGGVTVHLTVYLPLLICVPLVLWYGFLWAAIPAYFSTFLVAVLGNMPTPWLWIFPLANPLGLAMFTLMYRVSSLRSDVRGSTSIAGFSAIALVAALAGSAGAFVWVYANRVGVNTAYPVWQGWWLGGWLQALCFTLPTLWLLSPTIERWLAPIKPKRSLQRRDFSHRLLPAIVSVVVVLVTYVTAARLFSLKQFEAAAASIGDPAVAQQMLNSIDSLSYPLYVLAATLVAIGFFGYRAAMYWNHTLLKANDLLKEHNLELEKLATTDTLTGVYNRRKVLELLHAEFERAKRNGLDLGVMMIDADSFKRVNDTYGHLVGDEVITGLAGRLQSELREYDLLGRYGGEEFIAILPQTVHEQTRVIAERIRAAVAAEPLETSAGPLSMTVSLGFATLRAEDPDENGQLDRADRALLLAKEAGRNRVISGHEVLAAEAQTAAKKEPELAGPV